MIVILNDEDKVVYQKRIANDLEVLIEELKPYKAALQGVVVESTYNWYWQVDGLMAAGYKVHLANMAANQSYSGLKYTNDNHDATWLARLLRLRILAEGHIYPKEQRGLRELLRKRLLMVRQQTTTLLRIQGTITRYENVKLSSAKIKGSKDKDELQVLKYIKDENVSTAVQSQLKILHCIIDQIDIVEKNILSKIKNHDIFKLLQTIPGVGKVLAMTIMLEIGEIKRFADVGNFSSYCRCVESKRISNEKKKGENNRKNGNPYLGWAFIEATHHAIRHYAEIKKCYQRKLAKKNEIVALKTIANKLSRATYFVLRDGVEFDMQKSFG